MSSSRPSSTSRRAARGVALAAVLVAGPLLAPASSSATTVRSGNVFAYGSGQVSCYVVVSGGTGIECSSAAVPSRELDGYVALHRRGVSRLGERGDFPGGPGARRRLRVGDVWRPGGSATGIVCRLRAGGLRCDNAARRGFLLSPKTLRRF